MQFERLNRVSFDETGFKQCWEAGSWERAFELLIHGHKVDLLRKVVRWVGDEDDAADVLQNSWIKVWKSLPQFRFDSKPSSWLYRIVYNESMDHLRKVQRLRTQQSSATAEEHSIASDAHFDGDRAQRALTEALSTLPLRQKQVFELRYFDEMPYAEMASLLGLSEGALKASFHHAVQKIELALKALAPP
ncbi:sigma-70 family RNA polymerase sigma factor [bacterium]|nr:sigma-70 family RNA polymerase sigma factor [bacterium]